MSKTAARNSSRCVSSWICCCIDSMVSLKSISACLDLPVIGAESMASNIESELIFAYCSNLSKVVNPIPLLGTLMILFK